MNINVTLFGQMITFALFIFVTMKYVWPPITRALEERQKNISEGLAKAERGKYELELAQKAAVAELKTARENAAQIQEEAKQKAAQIIDRSKEEAKIEGERMLQLARDQISHEYQDAKNKLVKELSGYALKSIEQLLGQGVDGAVNERLLNQMIMQISEAE